MTKKQWPKYVADSLNSEAEFWQEKTRILEGCRHNVEDPH